MRSLSRSAAGAMLAVGALFSVAACGSSATDTQTAVVDVANAAVIDVRTPAEFNGGHLQGAQNIDVQSSTFTAEVSELPRDAQYVVYCRSGNRSAAAISQMEALGFTNLVDGGSVAEAEGITGLPVVN